MPRSERPVLRDQERGPLTLTHQPQKALSPTFSLSLRLEMDGLAIRAHGGLLEGLSERGMSMARPGDILTRRAVLERQRRFGDHLARVGPDDMHPENAIRFRIAQELDHALRLEVGLGSRVRGEGERADSVLDPGSLELGLVLAHPRDFRVRVHD